MASHIHLLKLSVDGLSLICCIPVRRSLFLFFYSYIYISFMYYFVLIFFCLFAYLIRLHTNPTTADDYIYLAITVLTLKWCCFCLFKECNLHFYVHFDWLVMFHTNSYDTCMLLQLWVALPRSPPGRSSGSGSGKCRPWTRPSGLVSVSSALLQLK